MKNVTRPSLRGSAWLIAALLLGGCSLAETKPVATAPARLGFDERSLSEEGLQRFLRDNLGRAPSRWDFEALTWVAFYFHPALEVARAQWATAQSAQRTAQARANPTLSVTPGFDSSHQGGVSPWFPAVNLDFLFPAAGRRHYQQEIARAEAESARLAVVGTAWTVRAELRAALTELAVAARREAAARAQAAVQRELLALFQKRESAGLVAPAEVSPLRLALLRSDTTAAEAATQVAAGRARVAAALGVPATALAGITLPPASETRLLSAAELAGARRESLRTRADVLAALAKLQAAESAIALETSRRLPDFHLGPGYQYDQGQNKWSVAFALELPLFNRNEGPIAEALGRRAEAAARLLTTQAQAIAAIDTAAALQAALVAQLVQARRVRDEAARQDTAAEQRFQLGAADQVERQSARLELVLADTAVAEAEAAAAQTRGQLEDALQLPFPRFETLGEPARLQDFKAP